MEYIIKEIDPYGAMIFNRVFRIITGSHNEDAYEEIALWCCDNLQHSFVLVVHKTRIVAGGSTDNKNSYEARKKDRDVVGGELISYYELRCDHKDAVLFKMRWQ